MRFIAAWVYRQLRWAMRSWLSLWPVSAREREMNAVLRNDVETLYSARANAQTEWTANRARLWDCVRKLDARGFLTWDVINDTMFVAPYAPFVRRELRALRADDWAKWRGVMAERKAGLPCPCLYYPAASANAIHHAYHLMRFEAATGTRVRDYQAIVEFGGGYGSIRRIVAGLGFGGRYELWDLPEFRALQHYYLSSLGIDDSVTTVGERRGPRLFIATWSLSESPLEERARVVERVKDFDGFLLAYQKTFADTDNAGYFGSWQKELVGVSWQVLKIEHLPDDYYLFGVRR